MDTYEASLDSNPSYISSLAGPMRQRHRDELLISKTKARFWTLTMLGTFWHFFSQENFYNAWEEDIAVVNIFFGEETIMGEIYDFLNKRKVCLSLEFERSIKMGPVDFIASLGGLFGLFLGFSIVSFVEIIYWIVVRGSRNMLYNRKWLQSAKTKTE